MFNNYTQNVYSDIEQNIQKFVFLKDKKPHQRYRKIVKGCVENSKKSFSKLLEAPTIYFWLKHLDPYQALLQYQALSRP